MDVSDKTAISMPMRNLISILAAVGIGVYAFFGIQERLNNVETRSTLMEADLTANTLNLVIKWPQRRIRQHCLQMLSRTFLIEFLSISIRGYAWKIWSQ